MQRHLTKEIHDTFTDDGWRLALTRYVPDEITYHHPILLCHGIATNHHILDMTPRYSLAQHIAREGFDTWLIDLRGAGLSEKPGLSHIRRYNWNFETYVEYDMHAAVRYIAAHTKSDKIFLAGYSMGGMVVYAYLQTYGGAKVHGAVTIGSSSAIIGRRSAGMRIAKWSRVLQHIMPVLCFGTPRLRALIASLKFKSFGNDILWNKNNVHGYIRMDAIKRCTDHIPLRLLAEFADYIVRRDLCKEDHSYSYRDNMNLINTPILFITGRLDAVVPPAGVKKAYNDTGSDDKTLIELSTANGYLADYGHVDMVLGKNAPFKVYPIISNWLKLHDD